MTLVQADIDVLEDLDVTVELVLFVDTPDLDEEARRSLRSMVDRIPGGGYDAVATTSPVTEAVKRVAGGRVVEAVDRTVLVTAGAPVVVRRGALRDVVATAQGVDLVENLVSRGLKVTAVPEPKADR